MADSKYFNIPFGATGDRATIPEATQPSGAVSYQQGFGPDYERDPATDPLAKRVPRDETNEYLYQITNSLKYMQLYGVPEWYATDDLGAAVNYPINAQVRHPFGGANYIWRSLVANNTAEPGTDATKWTPDEAFSFALREATLPEALSGLSSSKLITPRRLAASVQQDRWNYNIAGGTPNALTLNLIPAAASLSGGMTVKVKTISANTGAATLNINGLGEAPIIDSVGAPLAGNDWSVGQIATLVYDGANWRMAGRSSGQNQFLQGAGWVRFPGGLIMQWGGFKGTTSNAFVAGGVYESGSFRASWPIAFPTTLFQVISGCGSDVSGVGLQEQAWFASSDLTGANALVAARVANASITGSFVVFGM